MRESGIWEREFISGFSDGVRGHHSEAFSWELW